MVQIYNMVLTMYFSISHMIIMRKPKLLFSLKKGQGAKTNFWRREPKFKVLFSFRKYFLFSVFYFVKENHFLFSYRKLEIMFKISFNENNFLELKQTLI